MPASAPVYILTTPFPEEFNRLVADRAAERIRDALQAALRAAR